MTVLKIAVVGAGLIGKAHIQTIVNSSECCLAAIVEPSDSVGELAAQHGVPHFLCLQDLLDAAHPDGLILATPNQFHVSQAGFCLNAGIPTLLEKPVAINCEEGLQLAAQVRRTGIPLLVGHHRAHSAIMARACAIVASGQLGQLVSMMGSAQFPKPADYFLEALWRSQAGGGPILINMIHEVHNLRMLMGEITHVQAMSSSVVRGMPVEETVSMSLRFASGALGTFLLSDVAASSHSWEQTSGENPAYARYPDNDCYFIAGTRGSLSIPTMRIRRCIEGQNASWWDPLEQEIVTLDSIDPLMSQLAHFLQVIRGKVSPAVSVVDGLNNLRVVEAIAQAVQTGALVELEQTHD
ncbi:Gfo/Idh/MocA family protein [Granulosicoccus antarcticus]|uniref:1,5-anhydro-D-fructose reductase n=1 Tax=Granulosicoccus antarcticus IMCC3135 TaxID=1192854 RepID=A0A2Z2NX84_9GAMM|nr:Gfo/Idh/MocA family oxidoreductase [Granulosicoccus antarcticus]ASJ72347.1 1,5-anhydro-D-fructose reductase [Granulosicoccus antarcticus IMCC3135]